MARALLFLCLCCCLCAEGKPLIKGLVPDIFREGQHVALQTDVLRSPRQRSFPIEYYDLASMCRPPHIHYSPYVFDFVMGTHMSNTPYKLCMNRNTLRNSTHACYKDAVWVDDESVLLCTVRASTKDQAEAVARAIGMDFRAQWYVDDFPVVMPLFLNYGYKKYMAGHPIGTLMNGKVPLIYNHVDLTLVRQSFAEYYSGSSQWQNKDGYQIVRAEANPRQRGRNIAFVPGMPVNISYSVRWVDANGPGDTYNNQYDIIVGETPRDVRLCVLFGLISGIAMFVFLALLVCVCVYQKVHNEESVFSNKCMELCCRHGMRRTKYEHVVHDNIEHNTMLVEDHERFEDKLAGSASASCLGEGDNTYDDDCGTPLMDIANSNSCDCAEDDSDPMLEHLVPVENGTSRKPPPYNNTMTPEWVRLVEVYHPPRRLIPLMAIVGTGATLTLVGLVVLGLAVNGHFFMAPHGQFVLTIGISYIVFSILGGALAIYFSIVFRERAKRFSIKRDKGLWFVIKGGLAVPLMYPLMVIFALTMANLMIGLDYNLSDWAIFYAIFSAMCVILIIANCCGFPVYLVGFLTSYLCGRLCKSTGTAENTAASEVPNPLPVTKCSPMCVVRSGLQWLLSIVVVASAIPSLVAVYRVYWSAYLTSVPDLLVVNYVFICLNFILVTIFCVFVELNRKNWRWHWIPFRLAVQWTTLIFITAMVYYLVQTRGQAGIVAAFIFTMFAAVILVGLAFMLTFMGFVPTHIIINRIYDKKIVG